MRNWETFGENRLPGCQVANSKLILDRGVLDLYLLVSVISE